MYQTFINLPQVLDNGIRTELNKHYNYYAFNDTRQLE